MGREEAEEEGNSVKKGRKEEKKEMREGGESGFRSCRVSGMMNDKIQEF